jgi:hypothetical protein
MIPVLTITREPETPEEEAACDRMHAIWNALWEGVAKTSQSKSARRAGAGTLASVEALVHYTYHHGDLKDTPEFLDELMDYAQANELPHSADLDRRSLGSLLSVVVEALKVPDRQPD